MSGWLQLVGKYVFTLLWQFFVINKKVAQVALLYTEKELQPQNRKSKKLNMGIILVETFFLPHVHCGIFFL
jgi:hypothetical protein